MVRKTLIAAALAAMTLSAAACNTVRGVGEDLESAANAVDEET
jgi:predicted small secreted protein